LFAQFFERWDSHFVWVSGFSRRSHDLEIFRNLSRSTTLKTLADFAHLNQHAPGSLYFASSSRLAFAQSLSCGTAFNGGPPSVPQAHGPSILASVMQEQDFVFRQAQT